MYYQPTYEYHEYPEYYEDYYPKQQAYPENYYYDTPEHRHQLENKTYLSDFIKPMYLEDDYNQYTPPQEYYDPNDPANVPFVPLKSQDKDLEQYIKQFITNLPRHTRNQEEIAFCRYIAESILIDRRITYLQECLQNDSKFNTRLLFDFFDTKRSKTIDYNEFQIGLHKLDIIVNSLECYQLFKRFGGADDERISITEFNEIFLGFQKDQLEFMQFGASHYMHLPFNRGSNQYLTVLQRNEIDELMKLQLSVERNLNFLREVIGENDTLLAVFRQIDIQGKGYLIMIDLIMYMNDLGGDFTEKDLKCSFNRISKLRCNRINFNEFVDEFSGDTKQRFHQQHQYNVSPERKRDKDFIQAMHYRKSLQQQQQQPSEIPIVPANVPPQFQAPKQEQPRYPYQQSPIHPPPVSDNDTTDIMFPGFKKYNLRKPQIQ